MPAYFTHAVFSEKFHRDNFTDYHLFKGNISIEDIKTFSLGIDLSALAHEFNAHNSKTKEFLMNFINKVRVEKLQNNTKIMGMLYGHILHYFLDINMHPYIYYHEKGMICDGTIDSHTLFEGLLNSYFMLKIKATDIMHVNANYLNKGAVADARCAQLIDELYKKVYQTQNVSKVYQKTMFWVTALENFVKSGIFSKEMLMKASGFTSLLQTNGITISSFLNHTHNVWFHPITKEAHTESVDDLFDYALSESCTAIEKINEYLYNNKPFSSLENVFADISYDTALPCSVKKEFRFLKKYPE